MINAVTNYQKQGRANQLDYLLLLLNTYLLWMIEQYYQNNLLCNKNIKIFKVYFLIVFIHYKNPSADVY